jgi:hypothetical protein
VRRPSIVKTTGLVIVVSGLNVRDVELKNPNVVDGGGVTEDPGEEVEGGSELVEVLSREVVEGGVVDGGSEVEGGVVEGGSSVDVLGDSLVKEKGDSLSA